MGWMYMMQWGRCRLPDVVYSVGFMECSMLWISDYGLGFMVRVYVQHNLNDVMHAGPRRPHRYGQWTMAHGPWAPRPSRG